MVTFIENLFKKREIENNLLVSISKQTNIKYSYYIRVFDPYRVSYEGTKRSNYQREPIHFFLGCLSRFEDRQFEEGKYKQMSQAPIKKWLYLASSVGRTKHNLDQRFSNFGPDPSVGRNINKIGCDKK